MFFSASICSRDVAETLRSNESIKLCAAKLRKECASHRVPVPSSIVPHELVYGAMESFNHTKKKRQFLASEEAMTLSSCYFKALGIPSFATDSYR